MSTEANVIYHVNNYLKIFKIYILNSFTIAIEKNYF